jgi:hypothetical protein
LVARTVFSIDKNGSSALVDAGSIQQRQEMIME